jgi:RimJ/RimL family protein N-acetyltransferase
MQRVRIYEFPEPTLDYPKIQSLKLTKFPRNKTQALLSWIRNEEEKQLWSGNTFRDELNEEVFLTHLERKDIRPFSFLGQRDELICYGEIVISPENNAVLCRVIVMPSLRRSGIGKKFIGEIIRWCTTQNMNRIVLNTFGHNEPARACYRSLGFTEEALKKNFRKVGYQWRDLVVMEKKI